MELVVMQTRAFNRTSARISDQLVSKEFKSRSRQLGSDESRYRCSIRSLHRSPVVWIEVPPPLIRTGPEHQVPLSVIPSKRCIAPSQRNLWIGIERTDVRPGTGTVLLRIRHSRRVRILGIGWPRIIRQAWVVIHSLRSSHARLTIGRWHWNSG